MITFIVSVLCLITGYFIYGGVVARIFGEDPKRPTPCHTMADGVDYIEMPTWKVYLIQFLNIAGTGPIFGVIQGILFGPAAFIWIVLGCIFGGAVHDYMAGMLSVRSGGASLPEVIGNELGQNTRVVMRVLSLLLMLIIGTVFVETPAAILANMTSWGAQDEPLMWGAIIFAYYLLATLLPIGKIIGKIYPVFGVVLLLTAVALLVCVFTQGGAIPEVTDAFADHHPAHTIPLFPGLFITISCGAVSGFHATQSPMMARCMSNEKYGRPIFYGAMITEGLIALIWAGATIKFCDSLAVAGSTPYEKLLNVLTDNGTHSMNPAILVNVMCKSWFGKVGAVLAFLGIVIAPITSGDTAFRTSRLIMAEFLHYKQEKMWNRIVIALPIFVVALLLMVVDFSMMWRYTGWLNQIIAVFTFWAVTMWLLKRGRCYVVTLIPALFMTMVCGSYIVVAPEGLHLSPAIGYAFGAVLTVASFIVFVIARGRVTKK